MTRAHNKLALLAVAACLLAAAATRGVDAQDKPYQLLTLTEKYAQFNLSN